jgi:hypothetical protein
VPVPAPVTTGQAVPAPSISRRVSAASALARSIGRTPLLRRAQVLRGAVVGVQPAKAESLRRVRGTCQRHRGLARKNAAALRPHVDLDVHVHGAPGLYGGGREVGNDARVVDEDSDGRGPRERREARDLRGRHDLVGHEDVGDAGGDECGGLVDFLAADADGAARDLRLCDVGTLVRLRVRAQHKPRSAHRVGHEVEVVLERVEVDHQGGCLDRLERVTDACGDALHAAGLGHDLQCIVVAGRAFDHHWRCPQAVPQSCGIEPRASSARATIDTMRAMSRTGRKWLRRPARWIARANGHCDARKARFAHRARGSRSRT